MHAGNVGAIALDPRSGLGMFAEIFRDLRPASRIEMAVDVILKVLFVRLGPILDPCQCQRTRLFGGAGTMAQKEAGLKVFCG